MVTLQILVLSFLVRVRVSQQEAELSAQLFLCSIGMGRVVRGCIMLQFPDDGILTFLPSSVMTMPP